MDAIDRPIQTLLLLSDELLPLLLEYGQSSHSDYWILFTLEAETLINQHKRLLSGSIAKENSDDMHKDQPQTHMNLHSNCSRLFASLFAPDTPDKYCTGISTVRLLSNTVLDNIHYLVKSKIPVISVLHAINHIVRKKIDELIFQDIIVPNNAYVHGLLGTQPTTPSSVSNTNSFSNSSPSKPNQSSTASIWTQIRKTIVKDAKFELVSVLTEAEYKEYFIEYLQANKSNQSLISLLCWTDIRKTLESTVSGLQGISPKSAAAIGTFSSASTTNTSNSSGTIPDKNTNNSFPKRMTLLSSSSNQQNSKIAPNDGKVAGIDIYVQFRKLLQGLRDIHKKYKLQAQCVSSNASSSLTVHTSNSATGSSYSNLFGSVNQSNAEGNRRRRLGSISGDSDMGDMASSSACCLLSITDTLRLEIVTMVSHNQSIRLADIESLDQDYIVSNTQTILKLLHVLERETFQQLQLEYATFVESSVEFCKLVAYSRIKDYSCVSEDQVRDSFLWENVTKTGILNWTDNAANGATYVWLRDSHRRFPRGNSNDVETLQDIYLCGNMNRNSSDAIGNGENNTVKERRFFVSASDTSKENAFERKVSAIEKHLGLSTLDLLFVVDTLSLRFLIQILMLLLTDRNVILIGRDVNILRKIVPALCRFLWPFRLDKTHTTNIYNVPAPASSRSASILGRRSSVKSEKATPSHTKMTSNLSNPASDPLIPYDEGATIQFVKDRLNDMKSRDESGIYRGKPFYTYISTSSMSALEEILDDETIIKQDIALIDTDACKVYFPPSLAKEYKARLLQEKYFKIYNSSNYGKLRSMIDGLKDYQKQELKRKVNAAIDESSDHIAGGIERFKNHILETYFSVFWAEIFTHSIPEHLVYYSSPHYVIGCNVKMMLDGLIERDKSLCSHPPGYYHQRLSLGDDVNDDVVGQDGDVELWFVLDLLRRGSGGFIDLLYRHGDAMDNLFSDDVI